MMHSFKNVKITYALAISYEITVFELYTRSLDEDYYNSLSNLCLHVLKTMAKMKNIRLCAACLGICLRFISNPPDGITKTKTCKTETSGVVINSLGNAT